MATAFASLENSEVSPETSVAVAATNWPAATVFGKASWKVALPLPSVALRTKTETKTVSVHVFSGPGARLTSVDRKPDGGTE